MHLENPVRIEHRGQTRRHDLRNRRYTALSAYLERLYVAV
jgi:hypothetical protein